MHSHISHNTFIHIIFYICFYNIVFIVGKTTHKNFSGGAQNTLVLELLNSQVDAFYKITVICKLIIVILYRGTEHTSD